MPNARDITRTRFVQTFTADPAPGANATLALVGFPSKKLVAASFRLVTDANAAARKAHLLWHHAATQILTATTGAIQNANLTCDYYVHPGANLYSITGLAAMIITIASEIDLQSADYYDLIVDDIQAGDQLSNIYHFWKVKY